MLTRKTKYALQALIHLGRHPNVPILISEIAGKQKIPKKFLEQILLELKREGILESRSGKGGGYKLHKPPSEVHIGPIIRKMDGPLALFPCVSQTAYRKCDECEDEKTCSIRMVMKQVRDATALILDHTTLQHLISDRARFRTLKKVNHENTRKRSH